MKKAIFAGLSLLVLAPPLHAQGGCPGEPFAGSSPRAGSLSKFTPAVQQGGIVFHSWLDTGRSRPQAHLVVENGNAFPVAVRYRVELRGSRGSMDHGERCVAIRAHEYALDTGGNMVFAYHASPLWGVQVSDVRITSLRPPPEPRSDLARRTAAEPVVPAAARAAPPRNAPPQPLPAGDRGQAPGAALETTPVRGPATLPSETAVDTVPAAAASVEDFVSDTAPALPAKVAAAVQDTAARPRAERPRSVERAAAARREPRMGVAATIFGIAFGTLLTVAGAMLLVAVAGALYLLVLQGALHLVRRVLPFRARGK